MRKPFVFGIGLIGLGFLALSASGHKSVRAELFIPAPPSVVWSIITDASRYQEWNPVFVEVQGTYQKGNKLRYQMKDSSGKTTDVVATVAVLSQERELNQVGGLRGLMTFDHHWYLKPVENGTMVVQEEHYRGLGVWFWDPSWFGKAYAQANEGLRARAVVEAD